MHAIEAVEKDGSVVVEASALILGHFGSAVCGHEE